MSNIVSDAPLVTTNPCYAEHFGGPIQDIIKCTVLRIERKGRN